MEAYTSLLSGLASCGNIDGALRIFDKMALRRIPFNPFTLTALMSGCMAAQRVDVAHALLSMSKSTTPRSVSNLSGKGALGMDDLDSESVGIRGTDAVERTWQLPALTRELSMAELTALHGAYTIGLCQLAAKAKQQATSAHASSSSSSSSHMSFTDSVGSIVEEDESDSDLLKSFVSLTSQTADLIEAYVLAAQDALLEMEELCIDVDIATTNAFIQALCITSSPARIRDALLIFRALGTRGLQPDGYTYSILFTALGRADYLYEALQLYRSSTCEIDGTVVNSLLRVVVNSQDPLDAVRLYLSLLDTAASPDGKNQ